MAGSLTGCDWNVNAIEGVENKTRITYANYSQCCLVF